MIRICRRPSVFISLLASEPGLREANHAWLETAWLVEGARHRRLFSDRFETRCGGQGPVGGDPRWALAILKRMMILPDCSDQTSPSVNYLLKSEIYTCAARIC